MAIIYPDIDSVGWGDDVNANFRELNQNDTDIKATIGTETIGTTATTLKGAIKEVKGIADNNTTQLNEKANKYESIIYKNTFSGTENLNDIVENGIYQLADATNLVNAPNTTDKSWSVLEVVASNTYVKQIYTHSVSGKIFTRTRTESTWNEWKELAHNTLISTTFSVSEGYTATLNVVKKDSIGRTIVDGIIKKTDGSLFSTDGAIQIGVLPSGFTPNTVLNQPIRSYRGNVNESSDSTMIAASSNGALVVSNIVSNTVEVQFHLVFDTK